MGSARALLWELGSQGFFPPAEAAAIKCYVALTALGLDVARVRLPVATGRG